MTSHYSHGVSLRDNQKRKLAQAFANKFPLTIRLSHHELPGPDQLMLTKTQINKITKSMQNRTGTYIKISKTQIRKVVKEGGSLWSSLIPLATRAVPTIGEILGLRALSGLASEGVSQLVKKCLEVVF